MITIGTQLSQARKQLHFTQQQVADDLHVARQTVSSWETGRSFPDIQSLLTLSRLYHVSLDDLLKEGSDMVEDLKHQERIVKKRAEGVSRIATDRRDFDLLFGSQFGWLERGQNDTAWRSADCRDVVSQYHGTAGSQKTIF
ncbi:helix-turn-helix transcriptional regulator [Lacticaseibacillus camelliae]|uniref:helix-turn-helix transcriptional regulator n=1 Tax=Lacticaseibacillus camelliae TaxID=381742 RepID=UPI000A9684FB|nr:helix-turn-helix transcriptional regulator [Lacticaseibacillus camelliae]